jgi:hypothetical protein
VRDKAQNKNKESVRYHAPYLFFASFAPLRLGGIILIFKSSFLAYFSFKSVTHHRENLKKIK